MGGMIKINKTSIDTCEIIAKYSVLKNINLNKNELQPLLMSFQLYLSRQHGKGKMIMKGLES